MKPFVFVPTHKLNGWRDLAFDGDIKPYIGQEVMFIKVCKSGLHQIRTRDGHYFSVTGINLDPLLIETQGVRKGDELEVVMAGTGRSML